MLKETKEVEELQTVSKRRLRNIDDFLMGDEDSANTNGGLEDIQSQISEVPITRKKGKRANGRLQRGAAKNASQDCSGAAESDEESIDEDFSITQREINGSDGEASSQASVITAIETGPEMVRFDLLDPNKACEIENGFLFPTLREPEDLERLIEEEKQKTFANLTKRENEL